MVVRVDVVDLVSAESVAEPMLVAINFTASAISIREEKSSGLSLIQVGKAT